MNGQSALRKIAHKIELDSNEGHVSYFMRACGVTRFTFNWGLAEWNRQYESGLKPNWMALKKQLNAKKKQEFPWMYEVTKCAPEGALANLGTAWANYFRDLKKKAGRRSERPKFKKKGKSKDSFYLSNDQFTVGEGYVDFPHIGVVRLKESLRFQGRILGATVSRQADRWYISIQMEIEDPKLCSKNPDQAVGVDLGLNTDITLSTGKKFTGPKALRKHLRQLKRVNRSLHRKVLGSKNRRKAALKVAKTHQRIAHVRSDFIHKTTTRIVNQFGIICLEDLNTLGMLKNHKLARAISDVSWNEIERQIEYKSALRNGKVLYSERFFPSTKECRKCGTQNQEMTLGDRVFQCVNPKCLHSEDRDVQASRNTLNHCTHGRWGNNARGQAAAVKGESRKRFSRRKQPGLKREQCINTEKKISVGNYI